MKRKCVKCEGKGGWSKKTILGEIFKECLECMGKGSWYPKTSKNNHKTKTIKK